MHDGSRGRAPGASRTLRTLLHRRIELPRKLRTTTLNQNEQPVQVSVGNLVVPRRPAKG